MEILIAIACIGIILLTLPLILRLFGSVMSTVGELISNLLAIGLVGFVLWALFSSGIAPAAIAILLIVLLVSVLFWIGRKAGFAFAWTGSIAWVAVAWALKKTGLAIPLKRLRDTVAQKINTTPYWVVPAIVLSILFFCFLWMISSQV